MYEFRGQTRFFCLFPLHNEPSPMPVGLKLGGVGFLVPENVTFQESNFYNNVLYKN